MIRSLYVDYSHQEDFCLIERFGDEIILHSEQRHPDIVQLLGVHYPTGSLSPMLVMEYLPHTLSQLLKRKVPLNTYSILLDVANGLNYLHQKNPPIIHCNVTANNVLLTTEYKAKLSSFGSATYLDKRPLTTAPGAPYVTPPEALEHNPVYDHTLDVFAFGCLILHILTGQFPVPISQSIVDSEWDKRASYAEQVLDSKLIPLARQCLENNPVRRPNMNEAIEEIQYHNQHDPSHGLKGDEDIIRLEQQLKQKEQEYQQKLVRKEEEKEQEIQRYRNRLQQKERELKEKEEELRQSQDAVRIYQQQALTDDHWVINKDEVILTREELGGGAYATVKVGIFRGLRVAVKSLHTIIISDYNLALFSREMDIASQVRHPNLVQFIGATKVGNPLILTELMSTSLLKELEKNQLTKQQILSIAQDVALGLNYLHLFKPQPIIHRDVSSPNVLLEPSASEAGYKAKVADYGTAKLQQGTSTGTVMPGNAAYAAPEARDPDQHSPAMDVYSYSVLLMEMTLRCPPEMTTGGRERQSRNVSWSSMKSLIQRGLNANPRARLAMSQIIESLKRMKI